MQLSIGEVKTKIVDLFIAVGMSSGDAEVVADVLIDADLNGNSSHGIRMALDHAKKYLISYSKKKNLDIVLELPSITVCSAVNMIGMLSAYQSMNIAIEKAKESGMHMVLCRNANTFSAAGYYVEMAVKQQMIGIVSCNSPAQMAPIGGREKLLGTNPIAIGIPGKNGDSFIFDMATSAVAKSKINEICDQGGDSIPLGWATDINGNPTTNPQLAVAGLISPMAGVKGYGLSASIDLICGCLSGAGFLNDVGRFYPIENGNMNVGHSFVVINPVLIAGESCYERFEEYFTRIRNSKSIDGKTVYLPGDLPRISRKKAFENGLTYPDNVIMEIDKYILMNRKDSKC